jgi:hypothetical protein
MARVPTLILWAVPFLLVLTYLSVVPLFFHGQARWTGGKWFGVAVLLFSTTAVFSVIWYAVAYVASLLLGEYATFGVLRLITKIPGLHRHVIVTPPPRPDRSHEVWGRFGILLLITLGFELIFMILLIKRGDLAPRLAIGAPFRFLTYEILAGLGLGVLLAPAAPFLASRVRTRITDSLEFPLLWLAVLLLVVGGTSALELEILPGLAFNTALFLTSILLYAPAAWYVSLAFSRAETAAQNRFLRRAWRSRGQNFHFGRLSVTDEPEGSTSEV